MLVVTANWQIGDGSLRPPPSPAMVARFLADMRRAAVRGGWREDGRYEPVGSLDVVFAGDTFDRLLSREWLGRHRPWERGTGARAAAERVLAGALRSARRWLDELAELARHGLVVPGADGRGRPVEARPVGVPVRLTLLEGDLDRGLGRDAAAVFPPHAGIAVGTRWEGEGVRVEHGHEADPLWSPRGAEPGTGPTLGESLRIDLLARLAAADRSAVPVSIRERLVGHLATNDPVVWPTVVGGAVVGEGAEADALRAAWVDAVGEWRLAARRFGVGLDGPFDAIDGVADLLLGEDRADDVAALLRARPPIPRRDPPDMLVLGHPPATCSRPWDRPRLLCLGGPCLDEEPAAPGVFEVAPAAVPVPPPVVVVRSCGAGADGARPAAPSRPVGPSRRVGSVGGPRFRVVDAA